MDLRQTSLQLKDFQCGDHIAYGDLLRASQPKSDLMHSWDQTTGLSGEAEWDKGHIDGRALGISKPSLFLLPVLEESAYVLVGGVVETIPNTDIKTHLLC